MQSDSLTDPKRLRWMCRRGLKELDDLLLGYLENGYPKADGTHRRAFERLLELDNTVLTALIFGAGPAPDAAIADVVERIRIRAAD